MNTFHPLSPSRLDAPHNGPPYQFLGFFYCRTVSTPSFELVVHSLVANLGQIAKTTLLVVESILHSIRLSITIQIESSTRRCTNTSFTIYAVDHHTKCTVTLPTGQPDDEPHLFSRIHSCSLAQQKLHNTRVTKYCCIMKGCPSILHIKQRRPSNGPPNPQYSLSEYCGCGATSVQTVKWIYPRGLCHPHPWPSKRPFLRELLCQNYNLLVGCFSLPTPLSSPLSGLLTQSILSRSFCTALWSMSLD